MQDKFSGMKVLGTVESDRFEHRIVQPHFINPCCFGKDLADWIPEQLLGLSIQGFEIDEPLPLKGKTLGSPNKFDQTIV